MNDKWHKRYLEVASLISTWSKDPSTKVGAVIVRDNYIVATGYNGFPQGIEDSPERLNNRQTKNRFVMHAEMNAILQAGEKCKGATLYCTHIPCARCMNPIIQSGIQKIVFLETGYHSLDEDWKMIVEVAEKEGGLEILVLKTD